MITRSLFHQRPRRRLPAGQRRSPVAGPRHKGTFPTCGWVRCLAPVERREQVKRATQSNNYWSATANNPNNAWNVNNDNENNNNYVRAVHGGL